MKITTLLWELYALFTPYVSPFERRVDRFFLWVNSSRSRGEVERRMRELMSEDMITFSVWVEKRFKNYHYLTKRHRRQMYRNAEAIKVQFKAFAQSQLVSGKALEEELARARVAVAPTRLPELQHLVSIMRYLDPRSRFRYEESRSFGKLLADPNSARLVGDCNQIVTLYAALFSLKFPLRELQIKLLPKHVCLHLDGVDIEATNATFQNYTEYEYIAPLTEIVATNLLDVNDPDELVMSVEPEVFVKGAQLAFALSQKREVVEHNIRVAYHNLALAALKSRNFTRAYFYADKIRDPKLLRSCQAAEYNSLVAKVSHVKTLKEAKGYRSVYRRMMTLARAMGDSQAADQIGKTLGKI
ncbi:hypothetical protein CO046_03080 [Candidatus Peregrinibacteria bacterium CG_4_9_14_0_2_um_filter_53_11]|nr:MAG: hypothetical protein CO046_03080 [Candidatus Peregrinibacteria bacterium CG_4_9_14_0_2_um_filter_53_11]